MKADLNTQIQPNFKAQVSPKFVDFMHKYINRGADRLQNTHRFNSRVEKLQKVGYNNYSIEYVVQDLGYRKEYILTAIPNDGTEEDGIFISRHSTIGQLLKYFMSMTNYTFLYKMKCGKKINLNK